MTPIYVEPVEAKGRIFLEIPPAILDQTGIFPGEPLEVYLVGDDIIFCRITTYCEGEGAARGVNDWGL